MKNRISKILAMGIAATMAVASFAGCGSSEGSDSAAQGSTGTTTESAGSSSSDGSLSGTLSLDGSTSMQKVVEALREGFMAQYPKVSVTAQYTGSSSGMESLLGGKVDIGNSSRALTEDELSSGAVENIICIDGIAIIVNTSNTLTDISSEDLAKVYTGEITNCCELGGEDEAFVVVGCEAASGTRSAFEELLEITDECDYAQELDSTGAVLSTVQATDGAIGYVSLDVLDGSVVALQLDGVDATEEEIIAGNYALSRPFVMATMGEISEQNEIVQAWFDYINSDEGQTIISNLGLILNN